MWEVEYTDEFGAWWNELPKPQEAPSRAAIDQLAQAGPGLASPLVKGIKSSKHAPQMKELRVGTIRILFAFDPRRTAILLLGGDKYGQWKQWYLDAIPRADALYDAHLHELQQEGLI